MSLAIKETLVQDRNDMSFEAMRVREALIKHGLETPLVANPLDNTSKYEKIKESYNANLGSGLER